MMEVGAGPSVAGVDVDDSSDKFSILIPATEEPERYHKSERGNSPTKRG
jgi:hypothetical protein